MTRDTRELAAKCEAAEGADRALDEMIGMAVGLKRTIWVGHECLGNHREVPVNCPRYTSSLDAAMTLVPTEPYPELRPGKWWWMLEVRDGESIAHIAYENFDSGIPEFGATAATPALALCAAALKARAMGDFNEPERGG